MKMKNNHIGTSSQITTPEQVVQVCNLVNQQEVKKDGGS